MKLTVNLDTDNSKSLKDKLTPVKTVLNETKARAK